jgi:hypothetical protein
MLGWLKKKQTSVQTEDTLSSAFSRVKSDIAMQRRYLEELHSNHHTFRQHTSINHQRIADWIAHFDASIKHLEGDLVVIETKVEAKLRETAHNSARQLEEAMKAHKAELLAMKEELKRDLEVFAGDFKLKSINNVDNVNNVSNIMPEPSYEGLSNPEKWLVGVLFNSETPLSYAQISERTGKTISTVRVYMNQLKLKGFIEESALPNGIKIFGLKHRAKVKKLYNL